MSKITTTTHSIRSRQKLTGAKELMRIPFTPSHPLHEEIMSREDELITQRLTTVRSWVNCSRETVDAICPMENIQSDEWIPYVRDTFTTGVLGSREWRDMPGDVNHIFVRELLEEKAPTLVIATDGSIRGTTTSWGGAVWKDDRVIFEWSAGREGRASSYRAEAEALEDAFTWLRTNSTERDHTVILTDSMSLVSKLSTGQVKKTWFPILQEIRGRIEVIYIPGHAGIRYNERGDRLAGMG